MRAPWACPRSFPLNTCRSSADAVCSYAKKFVGMLGVIDSMFLRVRSWIHRTKSRLFGLWNLESLLQQAVSAALVWATAASVFERRCECWLSNRARVACLSHICHNSSQRPVTQGFNHQTLHIKLISTVYDLLIYVSCHAFYNNRYPPLHLRWSASSASLALWWWMPWFGTSTPAWQGQCACWFAWCPDSSTSKPPHDRYWSLAP